MSQDQTQCTTLYKILTPDELVALPPVEWKGTALDVSMTVARNDKVMTLE